MNRSTRRLVESRRRQSRQPNSGWVTDKKYQPGQKATRKESPTLSRAATICGGDKFGRTLHALSRSEQMLLTFALFHPRIVAVREQFVLQLEASDHPLQGHPEYIGHAFDPLPGILNVYLEMGVIKNYPKTPHPKTSEWVPLVLLNDCLLFVRDDLGIHVCNISVKRTAAQFQQHSLETPLEMQSTAQNEKALIRHQAEEEYFARAGIPTRRFTFSTFDQVFANNLDWLVKSSLLLDPKLSYLLDYLVPNLNSIIGLQVRCSEVAERFCREFDISPINWACLMARAIVSGQVKIDLHKKVLPDGFLYPSKPEDEARYDCLISREGF